MRRFISRLLFGELSKIDLVVNANFEESLVQSPNISKAIWLDDFQTELDNPKSRFVYEKHWK